MLHETQQAGYIEHSPIVAVIKEISSLLELLLTPEYTPNHLPYELTAEGFQRRKRKQKGKKNGLRH